MEDLIEKFRSLPSEQRIQFLDSLVSACGPSELLHFQHKLPDILYRDFVSWLPPELAQRVLCYLDIQSLLRAVQVSRSWLQRISDFGSIWRAKALEMGVRIPEKTTTSADLKSMALFGYKFLQALRSGQALKTETLSIPDLSFSFANFAGGQIIASAVASEDEGGRREVFLRPPATIGQLPVANYAMSTMKMTDFMFAISGGLNGMIRYLCLSNQRLNPIEELIA